MCGLVGLVNKNSNGFTAGQQEIFNSLLFVDYLRGTDSTGVFLVDNHGDIALAKEASNPIDFMNTKEYAELMKRTFAKGSALIGHNRKATRGTVTDENAHPFVVDDKIVLVHNGTMYGDHKKIADVEVDSHAIAHAIHEKKDVTAALSSFDAAYALIWYDFENGTMNFVRNNARPLWWMETSNSWIWSSEKAMLEFVKARHNLTVTDGPAELPADTHQVFTLATYGGWKATTNKLEIKKEYPIVQQYDYTQITTRRHRSAMESEWGDSYDNFQEPPFRPNQMVAAATPHMTRWEILNQYEREKIAKKNNKIITNAQFHDHVLQMYKYDTDVYAISFDYGYGNTVDDKDGYWLYCAAVDDPDVIIKFFFSKNHMDENRIIQMAGGDYVYKLRLGTRRWDAFGKDRSSDAPGYCIFVAEKATLVYGGGAGDENWYTKAIGERTTH